LVAGNAEAAHFAQFAAARSFAIALRTAPA